MSSVHKCIHHQTIHLSTEKSHISLGDGAPDSGIVRISVWKNTYFFYSDVLVQGLKQV